MISDVQFVLLGIAFTPSIKFFKNEHHFLTFLQTETSDSGRGFQFLIKNAVHSKFLFQSEVVLPIYLFICLLQFNGKEEEEKKEKKKKKSHIP